MECFDLSDQQMMYFFKQEFAEVERQVARELILSQKRRNDGRKLDEIRKIACEIDVLPCTHGSALFTRGQTQALGTLTLGTSVDEQKIDDLEGETYKTFMLHYNFPPFSVGEANILRGPGRREVGHGALAERAISPVIPNPEVFPYTIRIVSDILESNGSSSMASVCAASLSLMDGGVPITKPVSGIAMGLVLQDDQYAILSDISGMEDHLGDMDFKVAGTRDGLTAIQMDLKVAGLPFEILAEALEQSRTGRMAILDIMTGSIDKPRDSLKSFAPRIQQIKINPDKIATLIGPGGKMIRALTAETKAKIEIEDDGTVKIFADNEEILHNAVERVKTLTEEATVGKNYTGTVRRIESYGAFIEIIPGTEGLLHISRMANHRVEQVEDVMNLGDQVLVKVIEIDRMGKVKLSRKELIDEGLVEDIQPKSSSDHRSGHQRPPRRYTRNEDKNERSHRGYHDRKPRKHRDS